MGRRYILLLLHFSIVSLQKTGLWIRPWLSLTEIASLGLLRYDPKHQNARRYHVTNHQWMQQSYGVKNIDASS